MGIEVLPGSPAKNVVAIRAVGKLTADDYAKTLEPLIDEQLAKSDGLRVVIVLGDEFKGMEADAVWEDLKIGFGNLTKWKRCAVVTDRDWIEKAMNVFGWMSPGDVKHFDEDELADAMKWAAAND